jgi:putative Mg2+ transporter-C (MgtC) family protein
MWHDEFMTDLALPLPNVIARLLGAALLCGAIGCEREASSQSAGLRTHMTVGVAAACFALITRHIVEIYAERPDVQMDPIRMVEATTAGIAFLAAGMIVLSRGEVKNLTTGAGMWLAGAIGLAVGLGLWAIAVIAALIALLILGLLGRFTHRNERLAMHEADVEEVGNPPQPARARD